MEAFPYSLAPARELTSPMLHLGEDKSKTKALACSARVCKVRHATLRSIPDLSSGFLWYFERLTAPYEHDFVRDSMIKDEDKMLYFFTDSGSIVRRGFFFSTLWWSFQKYCLPAKMW